jgi:hypothetical protein
MYLSHAIYIRLFLVIFIASYCPVARAQVSYGASAIFGLHKVNPSYSGNAVQVRRACDNATLNIGFSSCGDLDTIALNAFAGLQNFPLNSITSAAATAYSLRKVNCSYAGAAINIRSSAVGSPTMDVGFTLNGDLDTAAMKTFVGSNSAFVVTWYDQTGNGRHASQAATASQPRIMLSGVIERQGSKPAIRFLGTTGAAKGLSTANMNIYGTAACFNAVAKVNTNNTYNALVNQTNSNLPGPLDHYNNQVVIGNGTTYSFYTPTDYFGASFPLGIWTYQASGVTAANIKMWHNSNSILTTASNAASYGGVNKPLNIGTRDDLLTALDGWISEVVTFSVLPSATDRGFLEWSQAQYYGISGVALGTLPAGTMPSAFVRTWYDQSGNGKNLVQTTNALQPRIINTGVVDKQNNIPAVFFNGAAYLTEGTMVTSRPYFATTIASRTALPLAGSSGYARLLNLSSTGDAYGFIGTFGGGPVAGTPNFATFVGDGVSTWNDIAANITLTSVAASPAILSMSVQAGATGLVPYINGTALNGKNGNGVNATGFILGGAWSGSNTTQLWTGYSYGLQIFNASIGQTRRKLLESNQSAYNNIAISAGKYTPPTSTSYNRFVNGIGRESATDTVLGTRSTVGMGVSSGTVAGNFLQSDGDYMTFGMNCPLGPGTSTANIAAPITQRWVNDWYINKTDAGTTGGTVRIYFDYSDYGYTGGFSPGVAANYELLVRTSTAGTFSIVAGTTKSVTGDRVIFDVNASAITTNAYYTIGTQSTSVSPLPIELLSFNAVANNDRVDLNWATATEKNNKFFTIERSQNGVVFEDLKTVNSKANNGNSLVRLDYSDVDLYPYEGTSYYRLKQTDFTGESMRSAAVDVYFSSTNEIAIMVRPNPNDGEFTLDFKGIKKNNGSAQITLFDALGKKVYQESLSLSKDSNTFQITPSEKLIKGIYFLSCVFERNTYTKKIVVN